MTPQERAAVVRRSAGLFDLPGRGLVAVSGRDRERWLNGMLTNDVAALEAGPSRSGFPALALTRQGRIVADLNVLWRPDAFWLELARDAIPPLLETLQKFIIADDVALTEESISRLALEGPRAEEILASACEEWVALDRGCCADVELDGAPVVVARFGWSGEDAYQLLVAPIDRGGVLIALDMVAANFGIGSLAAPQEVLEILRVEAGVPQFGSELDDEVLPAEAGLDAAISTTKGCYTGQEVVERMRSRGQVGHLLVGLRSRSVLPVGAELTAEGKTIGEVTSAVESAEGPLALGFVRRAHAEPGSSLRAADVPVTVSALPFVGASAPQPNR